MTPSRQRPRRERGFTGSLYHARGCKAGGYHEPGAATEPQAQLRQALSGGSRCPRVPGAAAPIPSRGSGQHRLRPRPAPGSAQIPAANRLLPPLRSDGRDCAAGQREGGGSVPPRNTRKTLPQLKYNKAIRTNTAAYSLNTRYFCNSCSASALSPSLFASVPAPPPDGRAPPRRGGRRHGPAPAPGPGPPPLRARGRAAPGPRRSSRGTPSTGVRTPGPAGRPGAAAGGGAPAGFARGRRRDTA